MTPLTSPLSSTSILSCCEIGTKLWSCKTKWGVWGRGRTNFSTLLRPSSDTGRKNQVLLNYCPILRDSFSSRIARWMLKTSCWNQLTCPNLLPTSRRICLPCWVTISRHCNKEWDLIGSRCSNWTIKLLWRTKTSIRRLTTSIPSWFTRVALTVVTITVTLSTCRLKSGENTMT